MRFIFIALTIFAVSASFVTSSIAQEVSPVFRGFVWGVSPAEVKKFEKAVFYDDRNGLSFFEDTKKGRIVYRYEFNDEKLWRIHARYMDFHRTTKRAALDAVIDEKLQLEKKYGKPVRDDLVWLDSAYRNIGPWFERAFGMGKVRIETEWQTADTHVFFQAFYDGVYYNLSYSLESRKADEEADQGFQMFNFND